MPLAHRALLLSAWTGAVFVGCGEKGSPEDESATTEPGDLADGGTTDGGTTDGGTTDGGTTDGGTTDGDDDGDGVPASDGDCDDSDPSVYPGAEDASTDGTDQNCDGVDGPDADADGYADAETGGDDCDDSDDSVYPGASETWDDGIDQDCDGKADVEGAACSADLTVSMPDGSSTTLDFCQEWDLDVSFEYDPDDPPEVLDFTIALNATTDAGFQCQADLIQEGVCGTGYYDERDPTSTTSMVLFDCSGVSDDYETSLTMSAGYLLIDTLDTGTDTGSFVGQPLPTTLEGHLHVWGGGYDLVGELDISLAQVAPDGEEQTTCVVTDGDLDGDGAIGSNFDGDDCDDTNAELLSRSVDGDCDGVLTADDCDDSDPTSTVVADDGDCDGALTEVDCDDSDSTVGSIRDEATPSTLDGIDFVDICAHSFDMGCTSSQINCESDHSTVMPVTITYDYYLSVTEVTQAQYQAVMGDNPATHTTCGSDCPVESLTWHEAAIFLNALSDDAGLTECYSCSGGACRVAMSPAACDGYRMPTEAEWEAAARCGEENLYVGGSTVSAVAWYYIGGPATTFEVAQLAPNACGIYDMSGNVREWNSDWYSSTYYTTAGRTDPTGATSGDERSHRGGGYASSSRGVQTAYRGFEDPDVKQEPDQGIRVARTVP